MSGVELRSAVERLVAAATRQRTALALRAGLTASDLAALAAIDRAGEVAPAELARTLMVSSSGATALIRRLEMAGLVVRAPGPSHQRQVVVSTTPKAAELTAQAFAPLAGDVDALAEAQADGVLRDVEHVLLDLAARYERHAERLAAGGEPATAPEVPSPVRWG